MTEPDWPAHVRSTRRRMRCVGPTSQPSISSKSSYAAEGAHAVLLLDCAGRHATAKLDDRYKTGGSS